MLISWVIYRQRKGYLLLVGNPKVIPKTRRGNIKSIRIEIRIRIKSIRSTSIDTRTGVRIKIKRRKRIRLDTRILAVSLRRSTMTRYAFIFVVFFSHDPLVSAIVWAWFQFCSLIPFLCMCLCQTQKRKHEGSEDPSDIHKHKKSKVLNFIQLCCLLFSLYTNLHNHAHSHPQIYPIYHCFSAQELKSRWNWSCKACWVINFLCSLNVSLFSNHVGWRLISRTLGGMAIYLDLILIFNLSYWAFPFILQVASSKLSWHFHFLASSKYSCHSDQRLHLDTKHCHYEANFFFGVVY